MGIIIALCGLALHWVNTQQAENVSFSANSLIFIGVLVSIMELVFKESK